MIGVVKFYSAERSFGFIEDMAGGPDAFVHASELTKAGLPSLTVGERVSYETEEARNGKGPRAINLALA
jgi:cold shock protein